MFLSTRAYATDAAVSEKAFNLAIDKVESAYRPIFAKNSLILTIVRVWPEERDNAHAYREGNNRVVYITGGFGRILGLDPLTAALCHELGYHLGGYPFNPSLPGIEWLSVEGQADYYSSFVCLRHLWIRDNLTNAEAEQTIDAEAKRECDSNWVQVAERQLCYRIINAAQTKINFYSQREGISLPRFSTPETNFKFTPQCRLDTILQGAICHGPFILSSIPGYLNPKGSNSQEARIDAEGNSCD